MSRSQYTQSYSGNTTDSRVALYYSIKAALDPALRPGKVRRFTPEEIAEMNKKLKEQK